MPVSGRYWLALWVRAFTVLKLPPKEDSVFPDKAHKLPREGSVNGGAETPI